MHVVAAMKKSKPQAPIAIAPTTSPPAPQSTASKRGCLRQHSTRTTTSRACLCAGRRRTTSSSSTAPGSRCRVPTNRMRLFSNRQPLRRMPPPPQPPPWQSMRACLSRSPRLRLHHNLSRPPPHRHSKLKLRHRIISSRPGLCHKRRRTLSSLGPRWRTLSSPEPKWRSLGPRPS